jgi:hypothetical protein
MALFGRKKKPERLRNIAAYYLSAIIDGTGKSKPLGFVPRFTDDIEDALREKHKPVGQCYLNETLYGDSAILYWNGDKVEAISFLSEVEARAFPGFEEIPAADLVALDSMLGHFPR